MVKPMAILHNRGSNASRADKEMAYKKAIQEAVVFREAARQQKEQDLQKRTDEYAAESAALAEKQRLRKNEAEFEIEARRKAHNAAIEKEALNQEATVSEETPTAYIPKRQRNKTIVEMRAMLDGL